MSNLSVAMVQHELLKMMKDVHSFCETQGIVYSLCGGSLLGAIRHKGFIPWDDDMDIMMDRKNYNLFLERFQNYRGYVLKRRLWIYRVQRESTEEKNSYTPTIDIFVLDNTPENMLVRKVKVLVLKILQGMLKEDYSHEGVSLFYKACLWITGIMGKLVPNAAKLWLYDNVSQIGNTRKTNYITCYNDLFKLLTVRYDADTMENVVKHPFEDAKFYTTEKYDSYLTAQYGDYMTPPREQDRVPAHL